MRYQAMVHLYFSTEEAAERCADFLQVKVGAAFLVAGWD